MEIFVVGGAVRDMLLGLPIVDRDWVVVGSTPQELTQLGYLPVGKDFPVFLHPDTREEYALARTERKTARGYHGFTVHAAADVTLEQDLSRRDLTINSIAACALIDWSTGRFGTEYDHNITALIDPYGGQRDIKNRVLRHVTEAFSEDPVRILRVARFAARLTDFSVAPETLQLMKRMVTDGEADALVAERVWQELSNGLMQAKPSRMMRVLNDCGALQKLLPELVWNANADTVTDQAALLNAPLAVRFACMVIGSLKMLQPLSAPDSPDFAYSSDLKQLESDPNLISSLAGLCDRLRVPVEYRELASVVAREHAQVATSDALDAAGLVLLMERCDAFRRPQRFVQILLACECISAGQPSHKLEQALAAAQSVATKKIAEEVLNLGAIGQNIGERIARAIHTARRDAVAASFGKN